MREIITKRNKRLYIFLVVISLFAVINSIGLLNLSIFKYVGIVGLVVFSMTAIIFSIWLFDRRPYIEIVNDTLVMIPGLKNETVKISDITAVRLEEMKDKPLFNSGKKNLVIEATIDGKTKKIELPEAKDVDVAYERLSQLIK